MRLVDFKLSLADLKSDFNTFFESKNKLFPISSIKKTSQNIVLISSTTDKPLTLGQLKKLLSSFSDERLVVSVASENQTHLIFGYRLTQVQIIFS